MLFLFNLQATVSRVSKAALVVRAAAKATGRSPGLPLLPPSPEVHSLIHLHSPSLGKTRTGVVDDSKISSSDSSLALRLWHRASYPCSIPFPLFFAFLHIPPQNGCRAARKRPRYSTTVSNSLVGGNERSFEVPESYKHFNSRRATKHDTKQDASSCSSCCFTREKGLRSEGSDSAIKNSF